MKKAECRITDAVKLWWKRFLNSKEITPVNLKGNKPRIFIGRTDIEAEAPIVWLPDAERQLIEEDPDAGKD